MFLIRLRSSVILMIITLFTLVLGGNILFVAVSLISIIGLTEIYKVIQVNKSFIGILGYIVGALYYLLIYFNMEEYNMNLIVLFLIMLLAAYVLSFPEYSINDIALVVFGVFYVAVMLSYVYKVRLIEDGGIVVWLIFIGSWGSDTCAYLVGSKIGRHKLSPKLSPKKSIEGSIGGIVGAGLLGFIFATIFKNSINDFSNPQLAFTIIGCLSSVISQVGDLAASGIKRNYDIKDYSNLIPGHGGILDRFDSVIVIAPIVYLLSGIF